MKKLRIHCFQHVEFEGLGCILNWIEQNKHSLTYTRFYEDATLPNIADFDWLIVMGGPMGIYDEIQYPWLMREKKLIQGALAANKTILGICLGSQLLADALGDKVYAHTQKEIGWFELSPTQQGLEHGFWDKAFNSSKRMVFHWHGDTFQIPAKAKHLAFSACCNSQAFIYKDNVLGLQFHLEVTPESLLDMLQHGEKELISAKYVQSIAQIESRFEYIQANNEWMFALLERLEQSNWE